MYAWTVKSTGSWQLTFANIEIVNVFEKWQKGQTNLIANPEYPCLEHFGLANAKNGIHNSKKYQDKV